VAADVSVFQNGCELACPGQEAFLARQLEQLQERHAWRNVG
jgi:hypothetical protein